MRGIAALLVVTYHFSSAFSPLKIHGYLAVDFFFALSGFVIARTYEPLLATGLEFMDFMRRRVIRLWPLFALGLCLALVRCVAQWLINDGDAISPKSVLGSFAFEIFMLPSPFAGNDPFPLNGPAWSLFFEMAVNIVFALYLFRYSRWVIGIICAISGALLVMATMHHGSLDIGWSWSTGWAGVLRVLFSFTAGMLISRAGFENLSMRSWLAVLPPVALGVAFLFVPPPSISAYMDVVFAVAVAPLLVILGTLWQTPRILQPVFNWLGEISYPLYILHLPLIFAFGFAAARIGLPRMLYLPAFLVGMSLFAYCAGRFVDPLIRRQLQVLLQGKPRPPTRISVDAG